MSKFLASVWLAFVIASVQAQVSVRIGARILRTKAPIDTLQIRAIGSAQSKASPAILQVSPEEAKRVVRAAEAAGAVLAGSPKVMTAIDQEAKITTEGDADSVTLEITPSGNSSTVTLRFKLAIRTVIGSKRVSRSASGMARLQEEKRLLIIVNPREGESTGLLAVLEVQRIPK